VTAGASDPNNPALATLSVEFFHDRPALYKIFQKLCDMSIAASELLILRADLLEALVSARHQTRGEGITYGILAIAMVNAAGAAGAARATADTARATAGAARATAGAAKAIAGAGAGAGATAIFPIAALVVGFVGYAWNAWERYQDGRALAKRQTACNKSTSSPSIPTVPSLNEDSCVNPNEFQLWTRHILLGLRRPSCDLV
jgi:hypothetical protein